MILVTAFTILCATYMIGQWIGRLSKGVIPSSLFCSVVLLIGFWTNLFPKDIVEISGLKQVYNIMSALIIVNMGTTLEFDQFKKYWKLVASVIGACVALTLVTVCISGPMVGKSLATASFPVLLGGIRATQIVTDALNEKGLMELAAVVVLVNSTQNFYGLPAISLSTKQSAQRLLAEYRANGGKAPQSSGGAGVNTVQKTRLIDRIPKAYQTPFLHLFTLGVVGILSTYIGNWTAQYTNGIVGRPLMALVLGVLLHNIGLLTSNPMQKSGTLPFFMFATIIAISGNLAALSPAQVLANIVPILILLTLGAAALFGGGFILGKVMKLDTGITVAASFGAYTGYPLNFQVAQEAIQFATEDPAERAYLEEAILPSVSLGSIISVTITSVIVAGAVANMF